MKKPLVAIVAAASLTMLPACAPDEKAALDAAAQQRRDALVAGFADPPMSARPRAWWHWMNGNITEDGIAKDLAWMKQVGLGGVQNFDANLATPQIVDKRLVYMEPDWQQAFRFAGTRAEELGLELAIAASPGWSETGGPWVPPEDALKKLVWSETRIAGGKPFSGKLASPPSTTGPFANIPKPPSTGELMGGKPGADVPTLYRDVRVLAFPATDSAQAAQPSVRLNGKPVDAAAILDADPNTVLQIDRGDAANPAILSFDYGSVQTMRSATIFLPGAAAMFFGASTKPALESSEDGNQWQKIADLPLTPVPTTVAFAPVSARHFRLVFNPGQGGIPGLAAPSPGVDFGAMGSFGDRYTTTSLNVGQIRLGTMPVIDRFEAKAGFEIESDYYALGSVDDAAAGIDPASVLDISARLQPDGTLEWTPPAGEWTVLRIGYSLLGTTNHPATPEATGLEVDKFDGAAVRRYMEHYLGLYAGTVGSPLAQQDLLDALLVDSIEVGAANWTPEMVLKFTGLRGYDPTPWLPAITGVIVGSREQSDRFLHDYRRTLADLMSSEHYATVASVAHEHGLIVYGEALESGRPSLGDDLSMRSHADIPMSAMWTHSREAGPRIAHVYDIRGAAAVAHIYGRQYVAAESMTSAIAPWDHVPGFLKRIIDLEFVNGVNRPVIHTSVHQPRDDKVPGLSLFIFGQYFNRHESWAPLARDWIDYMARSSWMLQQGRNVADLAYFYGEDAPPAALYQSAHASDAPTQWGWDFVSPDVITGVLTNGEDGTIRTRGGARYRALYLGGSSSMMSLPVLEKLAVLVRGGATLIGPRPRATPSLADDAARFSALVDELWGGDTGSGKVIDSTDPSAALAQIGVAPAFRFSGGSAAARIPFVERELDGGRLFFLSNPGAAEESVEARFRVSGKRPELWDAVSGRITPVSYRIEGEETVVPLDLASDDSVFVVFVDDATEPSVTVAKPTLTTAGTIDSPWNLQFQEGRRGPGAMSVTALGRWEESADPALRYFSGVATYANHFAAPASWQGGQPLWIDLGEVHDLAEVWINGQRAGGLWRAPWRLDVGALVQPGDNTLEVKVANKWVNRLIGDAQEGAVKETFTSTLGYRADAPLRPSGMIGPVSLLVEQ